MMVINVYPSESEWITELIPAILGAVVGGLFAFWGANKATRMAHKNNLDIIEKKNKELENAVILSIGEELRGLFDIYHKEFSILFNSLKEQFFLTTYYKITLDPFVVYKANADKIGIISDDELRNNIIKIYTFLGKFIEQLKIYDTSFNNLCCKRASVLGEINGTDFNAKILANLNTQNIIEMLRDYIRVKYNNDRNAISEETDLKIYDFLQNDHAETENLHFQSVELKNIYEKIIELNGLIQKDIELLSLRNKTTTS
ncbi:MAG: hypothetical protein E7018_02170 [Alphaproteobacteria bacterium]|nr:hypothetical protein [Alphaproteobacteria bacterium]